VRLIFLYGLPATGKLTVAQELAAITGYKLFHNHLVVDLLLSLFEFGSLPFVELREEIWLSVFERACRDGLPGLIFTFAPERTVRAGFCDRVLDVVGRGKGEVEFIQLICPLAELKARIEGPSRLRYQKLTSLPLFEELYAEGAFDSSNMPEARLTVDTSRCSAVEAASQIAIELKLRQ
jgi:hypothetical protein